MLVATIANLTATPPAALGAAAGTVSLVADMGTVLMHGTCFFVVIGSLLIGYGEGFLLSCYFGANRKRARRWMIGANYASAIIGLFAVPGLHELLRRTVFTGAPLYTIKPEYYILLGASFVLTVLIEWPFCAAAFGHEHRRWKRALRASLLVQVASYVVLSPLYLWLADYSVVTTLSPDRSLGFVAGDLKARVYYISADDGDVYSVSLDGNDRRHEYTLEDPSAGEKVYGAEADEDGGNVLWLLLDDRHDKERVLLGPLPGTPGVPSGAAGAEDSHECAGHPLCVWDLRPIDRRDWQIDIFPWTGSRIIAKRANETITLRYETTYDAWFLQCPTAVRDGQVVFEAAEQILVADLEQRKIGVVARGRGPCVVLEKDSMLASGPTP